MELCQSDLDLYIHGNGPRDVEMMLQVTRGLKYLHSIKIVHGDIKPQNILISLDGLPKLADFDCSWHMDKDPPRRTSTLGWQPPECYPIKDVKKKQLIRYFLAWMRIWLLFHRRLSSVWQTS